MKSGPLYEKKFIIELTEVFFNFSHTGQRNQSVDQFLSRLPQSVIKEGKIIDVRSGLANVIKVCNALLPACLLFKANQSAEFFF